MEDSMWNQGKALGFLLGLVLSCFACNHENDRAMTPASGSSYDSNQPNGTNQMDSTGSGTMSPNSNYGGSSSGSMDQQNAGPGRSGTNGSDTTGSDTTGSGTTGSGTNGSGTNGSGKTGSGTTGSGTGSTSPSPR